MPVEDGSGFMADDGHCNRLRNSGPDHIPHRGAPQIMKELSAQIGCLEGRFPRLTDISNRLALSMEDAGRNPNRLVRALVFAQSPLPRNDIP